MSGYTNTQIIDCSRQASAEGIANNNRNPAEWTSEVGTGIVLGIGDEISVHSAYVSELGAEAGEIEIKDRFTRKTTETTISSYISPLAARDEGLPTKYTYETNEDVPFFVEGKDQETNIIVSPYINANGEFYAMLPRKFVGGAHVAGSTGAAWERCDDDGGLLGRPAHSLFNIRNGQLNSFQTCQADMRGSFFNGSASTTVAQQIIKNDNSRFTIFRQDIAFFNEEGAIEGGGERFAGLGGAVNTYAPGATAEEQAAAIDKRDPALLGSWKQVRDVLTLNATPGFNSPEDVATELTLQMNKQNPPVDLYFETGGLPAGQKKQKIKVASYIETPMFKTYNCGSWDSLSDASFTQFRNAISNISTADLNIAHNYMSSYQHLAVKRPKLFTEGRKLNAKDGYLILGNADVGNCPPAAKVLNLGIPWSEENLSKISAYLDVQATYPEIFEEFTQSVTQTPTIDNLTFPVNKNKTRFLHFNEFDEDAHFPSDSLGYDLYGGEAVAGNYSAQMATSPLFFDFNPDTVGIRAADVGYSLPNLAATSDYGDLAYGFARRVLSGGIYYIGIQFSQLGDRLPSWMSFFSGNFVAKTGGGGRRFGFDYHFSAYANPCMILTSGQVDSFGTIGKEGWVNQDYYPNGQGALTNGLNQGVYSRRIYLGADGPLMGFNPNTSRFELSNLHVAEREGNVGDAGTLAYTTGSATPAPGNLESFPGRDPNPNGSNKAYKINKQMLANNYCVNVTPYTATVTNASMYPSFIPFNQQLEPWLVYDSQCGIFVEDFIVNEFDWDTNLMGVMGFRYSQLNKGTEDRQTTVQDYKTSSSMFAATTNARVNEADVLERSKNGFNNPIYNLSLPTSWNRVPAADKENITPAITFPNAVSTTISAQELPTKSLRPYYTIRSDLINSANWLGGNNAERPGPSARAIVGIVDKVNGYADFFTQESSQLTFTNTEPRVITSIRTSIHDPNGTFADVDNNSSVIYMIKKQVNVDLNPVQTLLASKKKSDQETALAAEMMLKDPADMKTNYKNLFQ